MGQKLAFIACAVRCCDFVVRDVCRFNEAIGGETLPSLPG